MNNKATFHTYEGFINAPDAPSVRTVAICLCRETRYCGNSPRWWNVGLHSFVVADLLPEHLKFDGLVHDEPECITGDIPHDLKTKKQRIFEDLLMERFYHAQGVKPPTAEEFKLIKKADYDAVHGEVWTGTGTKCLQSMYSKMEHVSRLTKKYRDMYTYEDCLEPDGRAVKEFIRRFELYKRAVKR
jgi:hypothetical protein